MEDKGMHSKVESKEQHMVEDKGALHGGGYW